MKDQDGRTPLHPACQENASIVDLLINDYDEYTEAAQENDVYGNTPLHLVCRFDPSSPVIELLLEESPDAIRLMNHVGHTPLHIVAQFHP